MSVASSNILGELDRLKREYEDRMKAALQPARQRLAEIDNQRSELDREEAKLLELLGEAPKVSGPARRRSAGGGTRRRIPASHKKEVIARFINEGHIKDKGELTRGLRQALKDQGFGLNDFRKMNDYLPGGWTSKSNGRRGNAAETIFYRT